MMIFKHSKQDICILCIRIVPLDAIGGNQCSCYDAFSNDIK